MTHNIVNIMNYWLVKSEPFKYSWEQFEKDEHSVWDGVRNYAARLHLRAMKKGDKVLFYHSNEGLSVVGIAAVTKTAYQDPTTTDDWSVVDLKPVKRLKNPVTLAAIKNEPTLANIALIRIARLSVIPLKELEYKTILDMSK